MNTQNMTNEQLRNYVANQCGYNPPTNKAQLAAEKLGLTNKAKPYALQVCNAGKMPEDFDSWLKANGDSIEIGMPLDRTEATAQWFDDKAKTERHPFE